MDEEKDLDQKILDGLGHPRGTLAIVLIYAALFALGWLALYLGAFVPRGTPGL